MIIAGAGLAGLLCGAINRDAVIYEDKQESEIGHQAVLRMKTDAVEKATGIKFKKVKVQKSIWFEGEEVNPSPRMTNLYSKKVSGMISDRSISNMDGGIRFIPPDDFSEQLKKKVRHIEYGFDIFQEDFKQPMISTIPMTIMSKVMDMDMKFEDTVKRSSRSIKIVRFEIENCDIYSTVYYPDPEIPVYRASINGNTLIVESVTNLDTSIDLSDILESFGIFTHDIQNSDPAYHAQKYGKINSMDENTRQNIILDLTMKHNIYSLGRFATWRPKLMLDSVVNDIFVIKDLIESGRYASVIYNQKGEK